MDRSTSLVTMLGLAALAVPAASTAQTAARPLVRIGGTPNDDMTPIVYAQRTGMFDRSGLEVDVEKGLGGAAVAAAVAGGSYDIGKSVISALLDAHERGVPFRIIAPSSIEDLAHPYGGIIVSRDTPIASGKDFTGKTVGLSTLGSIARVGVPAWIDQHGGDGSSLKFIEIPQPAMPQAVEQGRIFAGEVNYPILGAAMATGRFTFIPVYGSIAKRFIGGAFYATESYAASHPEVIRTFTRVYYQAARYTNAHHDATVQMMSEFTGVAADIIASRPRVESATELNLGQIQPTIDLYAKYGLIKRSFSARELVDPGVPVR